MSAKPAWKKRIVGYGEESPDQLLANPANFRTHPKHQQDALAGILAEVGVVQNVIVNQRTGFVVDGHLRISLALRDNQPTVPVTYVDLAPHEEALILATLDPISALATADAEKLRELLDEVSTSDAAVIQMLAELAEREGILEPQGTDGLTDPDDVPEPPADPITRPGDLWTLGRHRLLCGDSTAKADVRYLMGGELVDVVFTSPPYAQQRDYTAESTDKLGDWDSLMQGVFSNLPAKLDAQVLVNLGLVHSANQWVSYWDQWIDWMSTHDWRTFGWYVWDQGPGLPGNWNGRLAPSFEFVFHFNKSAIQPHKWIDKKPESVQINSHGTGMRRKDGTMSGVSSPEASQQPTKIPDNVIRVMRHKARNVPGHPAMFPVALPEFILRTWPGTVYEPFMGSGTTMIAAETLALTCYGMEVSPAYCDVIVNRWQAFTGQTATRAALHAEAAD